MQREINCEPTFISYTGKVNLSKTSLLELNSKGHRLDTSRMPQGPEAFIYRDLDWYPMLHSVPHPIHDECSYLLPRIQRGKIDRNRGSVGVGRTRSFVYAPRFCFAQRFTSKLPLLLLHYGKIKHTAL